MAKLVGRRGHARVVVMSIIDAEIKAVRAVFGATGEIGVTGDYTLPQFASKTGEDRQYPFVVTRSNDRSNTPATLSTQARLEWYRPEVVLVVGIGGGIQRGTNPPEGPGLGDVVIGRYVHYADYTKNLPGGNYLRYISIDQPSAQLIGQHADTLALEAPKDCFSRLATPRPDETADVPQIHVSELVAVESIAGNPTAEKQIEMLDRFDNAEVVDMESMGVGRALHETRTGPHYSPLWLPVRGISDLVTAARPPLSGKNEAGEEVVGALSEDNNEQRTKWKDYACFAAACVGRSLVERILNDDRPPSDEDNGAPRWLPPSEGA